MICLCLSPISTIQNEGQLHISEDIEAGLGSVTVLSIISLEKAIAGKFVTGGEHKARRSKCNFGQASVLALYYQKYMTPNDTTRIK